MRSIATGLALLLVVLAACGSQDPAPPPETAPESDEKNLTENVVETGDVTPPEPETLIGEFITTEGEHVVDAASGFEIHVVRSGNRLNYEVWIKTPTGLPGDPGAPAVSKDERVTKTGPTKGAIDPKSKWFIHVEAPGRYWVFDGAECVTLFEYTESSPTAYEVSMTDLVSASDGVLAEMPTCVKERIPPGVLARRK